MSEITADQVSYCRELTEARRLAWRVHAFKQARIDTLEEAASSLETWYPDNVSTNAFCAAIRSLKTA